LSTDRIVLGIDPGTTIMGYGIIHIQGQRMKLLAMGVLKLQKVDDHPMKLKAIFDRTVELITEFKPDELAVEAPFFGKNVQSMLKLGRAQGVAIAAALHRSLPVFEYSPRKIKQSITGSGSASKEQVAAMLQSILSIADMQKQLDATDGLAAAVCHYFQNKVVTGGVVRSEKPKTKKKGSSYNNWQSFLNDNPERKA
jgi:crossover junction endodeoxyribonuclease RuvC